MNRLIPRDSVKYLGILLDEHLQWAKQQNQVKTRLNQALGMLSKLRYHSNLNILRIVYRSIFGSHLRYDFKLWDKGTLDTLTLY